MNLEHWNWNTRGSTFLQYDRMLWFVLLLQLQKSSNGPFPCAGSNVCTTSLNGLFRPFRELLDHGSLELDQLPSPKGPRVVVVAASSTTGQRQRPDCLASCGSLFAQDQPNKALDPSEAAQPTSLRF